MNLKGTADMLHFTLFDEATKLRDLLKANPSEYATLCNDEDMQQLPFKPNDLGFFMVLVPGKMHEKHGNFSYLANEQTREQAQAFLIKHTVQQLSGELLLVSTACTWDVVPDKVKDATTLGFGAIAFTTPERLQVLAESPEHMH
jgi:hypothetical protein